MTTLDNINENITNKIELIELILDILYTNLRIDSLYSETTNSVLKKNIEIFKDKNQKILEKIETYEVGSSLFLSEYYEAIDKNDTSLVDSNSNIYNDSIFLLNSNSAYILSSDLLELKNIYYANYYVYKYYKPITKQATRTKSNKQITKTIYNDFNIFISINNIYDIFDNFIRYAQALINLYCEDIKRWNISKGESEEAVDKHFKQTLQHINQFNKTKLNYVLNRVSTYEFMRA